MKYLNKILIVPTLFAFVLSGCEDTDFEKTEDNIGRYVAFENTSLSFSEAANSSTADGDAITSGNAQVVTVYRSTSNLSDALTLSIDVDVVYASTTDFADAGEDASSTVIIDDLSSFTIPAGEVSNSFTILSVDDEFSSGNKVVSLQIQGVSDAQFGIGEQGRGGSATIIVVDDDCPLEVFEGSLAVTTVAISPAGCGTIDYTVQVELVEEEEDGTLVYEFSDITGGLYVECYGSADNPAQVFVDGADISVVNQPDVVYGGDIFNGSGSINTCDRTFTIQWSNGFGDAGISTFQY